MEAKGAKGKGGREKGGGRQEVIRAKTIGHDFVVLILSTPHVAKLVLSCYKGGGPTRAYPTGGVHLTEKNTSKLCGHGDMMVADIISDWPKTDSAR